MTTPLYLKARRHLGRRDPQLKSVIAQVGPCTLTANPDGFHVLVNSIISQQISGKAAKAIGQRLLDCIKPKKLVPKTILGLNEESLQGVGLSGSKRAALFDLATRCHDGSVAIRNLPNLDDEEVISQLIPVRGIGRWTAEMFLIFSLGRLDVLPVADYGLRAGVQKLYGLDELPNKKTLEELAEPWRPYRSIGTWYVWRSLG